MQRFCTYCGASIDSSANFCPNCGKRTAPAANQPKKRLILIGTVVVVCVIIAVLGFFIERSSTDKTPPSVSAPPEAEAPQTTVPTPKAEPPAPAEVTAVPTEPQPENAPTSESAATPSAPAEPKVEVAEVATEPQPTPAEPTADTGPEPIPPTEQDTSTDVSVDSTAIMEEKINRCLDRRLYLYADRYPEEYTACLGEFQNFPSYTESWTFRDILDKDLFDIQNWFYPSVEDKSVIRFNGTTNTPEAPWEVTIEFTFTDDKTPPAVSYYLGIPEDGVPNDVSAYEYRLSPLTEEEIAVSVDIVACCFVITLDPNAVPTPAQAPAAVSFDSERVYQPGDSFTVTGILEYNAGPGGWTEDFCFIKTPATYRYNYQDMDGEWYEHEDNRMFFLFKEDVSSVKPYVGQLVTVSGTFETELHGVPYLSEFTLEPIQ